ncbi:class I mannose-6-phosphate isomerase [Weizmannia sp. FSL W8-0401]|uniref:class I mannose-6-phosphate isomerase n=1 Tax=Weizmannia sp. FSL W8-0401 TaxID=2954554 RepID=UPI0030FBC5C6
MLILEPISKRRIWGTAKLHEYSGDKEIDKIGSVYTISATQEISSPVKYGSTLGKDLYSLTMNHPSLFGLQVGEPYPIIVSMTAAGDDLSIQVHPTDDYARKNEHAISGKSESWYFIEGPESGWIYAGSKLEDKGLIAEKMREGKFREVVDIFEVNQHDLVFIPAGTLHALTKGSLVYEIQQSTDLTYRFYDYDRIDRDGKKRELHLEKAISTLQPAQTPKKTDFPMDQLRVETPYSIFRTHLMDKYTNTSTIAQAVTVISGTLVVEGERVEKGTSLLVLPCETVLIQQSAEVIIATPNTYWR